MTSTPLDVLPAGPATPLATGTGSPKGIRQYPVLRVAISERLTMSESVGTWLRQQRESRCWSVREMARRLRDAARTGGDTVPSSAAMANMIRRWERGSGMSERYRMHYCQAFGTAPAQFGGQAALPMRDVAETDCQAARQLLTAMTDTDTAE